jgi:acyl-CoA dehydrogenase
MYRYIYRKAKRIIPKISETELIALKSGGTSIDRDIFSGNINYKILNSIYRPNKEEDINLKYVDEIISKVDKLDKNGNYDFNYHKNVMKILGNHKFLGFIIDNIYGGNKISITNQSKILTKLASYNPALGICTMVPNSLGPGELLLHYGTSEQKTKYLSKLANGTYIPCFGLTGPHNGSDATGSIDNGIIVKENGKKVIKVNINKRYITLAPIANLIGIAFNLKDPDNLCGREGITLVLIEENHTGLNKKNYHKPLDVDFPNGTLKGELTIDLDNIIGGEEMIGQGWKMLMECLAVGRAVSLPASANASNIASTVGIYHYINHRKQFKIPIGDMEGVRVKYMDMLVNTWIVNSGIEFTNNLLDYGKKPAVISAIMKYQSTERGRNVINNAMDIYGGSGICLGRNNFLEKFYKGAPIGITVEGSNTLTKSLMVFGQGLNNSHPHIFDLFMDLKNNDIESFGINVKKMSKHVLLNYVKSFSVKTNLENLTINFANLANFMAIYGGKIKSKQMMSGEMTDVLSNIYLMHSLLWMNNKYPSGTFLSNYCMEELYRESVIKMNNIIDNYDIPILNYPLKLTKKIVPKKDMNKVNSIYLSIQQDDSVIEYLTDKIYIKNTVLEDLISLNKLKNDKYNNTMYNNMYNNTMYNNMYNNIIHVGEFS